MNFMRSICQYLVITSLIISVHTLYGQQKKYDLGHLLKTNQLTVYNREASKNDDNSIKLNENAEEGIAWVNGVDFSTGVIEVDLQGQDVFQKSFLGIAFQGVDEKTYDAIYFRPFNFHAKDSVRHIHAVQYISHPEHTWKKLREEQTGQYEKEIVNAPDPNGWFHAKIEVDKEGFIKVYVNNFTTPSLTVKKLNTRNNGLLGLWVGDGSGGNFKNLTIIKK